MTRRRVVLVQFSSHFDGSTISGHLCAQGLAACGWDVHVAFAHDGPYLDVLREEGFDVSIVPRKCWLRTDDPVRFVRHVRAEHRAARTFYSTFTRLAPDVVYVNTLASLAPVVAANRLSIPVVWHLRELFAAVGGEMRCPGRAGRLYVRRTIGKRASEIVAISRAVSDDILGADRSARVRIVPNAVADHFFSEAGDVHRHRAAFGLPQGVPLVGVPGTLRPMKGHPFFLRAVPRVLAAEPSCHFALTGGGTPAYRAELVALANSLGVGERVHFTGTVRQMEHFYRACDAVCIPSVAEPFGRIVIEAFASGVPVVASAVGGILETVRDGESGLLVAYGDEAVLADRLVRILRDEALGKRLVAQARTDAETLYHARAYGNRICEAADAAVAGQLVSKGEEKI